MYFFKAVQNYCVLKTALTLFSLLPIASRRIGSVGTFMSTMNNVYSELWLSTRLPVYIRRHKLRYDWGLLRKLSTSCKRVILGELAVEVYVNIV